MGPRETAAILSRAERVKTALAALPVTTSLVADPGSVPWDALEDLYGALSGLPGIGLARATKVLHKKRPRLIPILDDVVQRYLTAVDGPVSGDLATRGVSLTRSYQRELLDQLPILRLVSAGLAADGVVLSECRLLDIYLWAYSGTYKPAWQRAQPSQAQPITPTSPGLARVTTPVTKPTPSPMAPGDVERYLNDDSGYLTWLSKSPAGYVLNCAPHPTADYLKLHRTSCPHLNRPAVRSWTTAYQKVCSDSIAALDAWAEATAGARPDRCPVCHPV